jgi:hypothetical protein
VVVERQQAVPAVEGVSADQEVRQYVAWAAALFLSPAGVRLKSASSGPPNRFLQSPVNVDAGGSKE